MKYSAVLFLSLLVYSAATAQIRVMVEPADTARVVKPRTLDSTSTVEAFRLYETLLDTENKMRDLEKRLHSDIPDANLEDDIRRQIGQLQQDLQTTIWDYQIERALQRNDKSLLRALHTAFTELAGNKATLQQSLKQEQRKLDRLLEDK